MFRWMPSSPFWDVDTIYKVPMMLHEQGLDEIVCRCLDLNPKPAGLSAWEKVVDRLEHPKDTVKTCHDR